ncbi:MAG: hypothetical protein QF890_04975 [Myxococcota bacterium]|jgi:hypothetical protein|nr:hypothetical protein [Deltaproteobacteria bacterium]MCP4240594.1 hypothetical protein [bacterium]MDP6073795.1 hypothetical protein [Myxococcota bacterium]MDP6244484.1 hypothetical protein [Myxococcota bacterium]MDP7073312.1 hypothetical protein [Myxococcota bacterium]
MRNLLVVSLLMLVFVAPAASGQTLSAEKAREQLAMREANAHPAECARLRRQIDHVAGMQSRANHLGNSHWEQRIGEQVGLFRGIQAARCPNDVPVDEVSEALVQLLKLAAKGAATYFTFGMAGF